MSLSETHMNESLNRCNGKTKNGEPCRNFPMKGSDYCYIRFHGPSSKPFVSRILNLFRNRAETIITGVVLMMIPLGIAFHRYAMEAQSGVLDSINPASTANISSGAGRLHFDNPDGVFLREGSTPILEVKLQRHKRHWFLPSQQQLLVSATIRDATGNQVARLRDNEWTVIDPMYDRNYTSDTLEVRDRNENVVLQVVNFGHTIHIAGVFRCKNGWINVIAPARINGLDVAAIEFRPPWMVPQIKITNICDYPSALHFGSCPGVANLRKLVEEPGATSGVDMNGSLVCSDTNIEIEKVNP